MQTNKPTLSTDRRKYKKK